VHHNSQGSFVSQGRQDILTEAIGIPEHPSRCWVWCRGKTIFWTSFPVFLICDTSRTRLTS